jgi:hypothetical protein
LLKNLHVIQGPGDFEYREREAQQVLDCLYLFDKRGIYLKFLVSALLLKSREFPHFLCTITQELHGTRTARLTQTGGDRGERHKDRGKITVVMKILKVNFPVLLRIRAALR